MDEHESATPASEPVSPALPPMPGEQMSQWTARQPSTPAAPARRRWPVVVALAVALVAAVVTFLVLRGGGSSLPDRIGGQDRVESGPMAEVMESFDGVEIMGVSFDVALYGGELLPSYMVTVINGDMPGTDPQSLLTALPSGVVSQDGATVDFSKAISEQVGDTEYVCVPAASDQPQAGFGQEMTMCVFQGGEASGIVISFLGEDLQALMDVTQELHDGL